MTDRHSPEFELDPRPWPKNGLWFGLVVAGLVGLVLIGGALVSASFAEAKGRFGFGHHRGPWGHGDGAYDPEKAREHAEQAAEWVLRYVDASDAQREQVNDILGRSVELLHGLGEQHRENREALIGLLRETEIDRDALENLRQAELQLADSASRELTSALADVSGVLTPEQRAELIELAGRFRH
jgi:Spy/CpxP family protein refolding chaperone